MIVLVSNDLMFASRVKLAAEPLGLRFRLAPGSFDPAGLPEPATLIAVDLHLAWKPIDELVRELRATTEAKIVAYAGHVMIDALREARRAECDEVLTRGEFDRRLGELVAAAAAARSPGKGSPEKDAPKE